MSDQEPPARRHLLLLPFVFPALPPPEGVAARTVSAAGISLPLARWWAARDATAGGGDVLSVGCGGVGMQRRRGGAEL